MARDMEASFDCPCCGEEVLVPVRITYGGSSPTPPSFYDPGDPGDPAEWEYDCHMTSCVCGANYPYLWIEARYTDHINDQVQKYASEPDEPDYDPYDYMDPDPYRYTY